MSLQIENKFTLPIFLKPAFFIGKILSFLLTGITLSILCEFYTKNIFYTLLFVLFFFLFSFVSYRDIFLRIHITERSLVLEGISFPRNLINWEDIRSVKVLYRIGQGGTSAYKLRIIKIFYMENSSVEINMDIFSKKDSGTIAALLTEKSMTKDIDDDIKTFMNDERTHFSSSKEINYRNEYRISWANRIALIIVITISIFLFLRKIFTRI